MNASKPLPYNTAKISLTIQGQSMQVVRFEGSETLSQPFRFDIEVLHNQELAQVHILMATAILTITGVDNRKRNIVGIVTEIEECKPNKDKQTIYRIIVESGVKLLSYQTDSRVIIGKSIPDIVNDICIKHGLKNPVFNLSKSYPVCPYVVQANETDLDFMQRVLATCGISYWSGLDSENEREIIHFTDHNVNCPYIARKVLEFKQPSSLLQQYSSREVHVGVHKLRVIRTKQCQSFAIQDWNENTPETILLSQEGVNFTTTTQQSKNTQINRFGLGSMAINDTESLAKQHAQNARVNAWNIQAQGNVIDMAAGFQFSLDASEFDPECSGDFMIIAVQHRASQIAGLKLDGDEIAYRFTAQCIRRETDYAPAVPSHPEVAMTFTARIESQGDYATLDEQGRYQIRNLFDLSNRKVTQASVAIRKLQIFGGPPSSSAIGMHLPLQHGDEVLVSCLNGDPNRPMIIGSVYTAKNISPVNNKNKQQNILKTKANNALIMDDTIKNQSISLRTDQAFNIMRFDANSDAHKLLLKTEKGSLKQFALKTHRTKTGGDFNERVGNERIEIIENEHKTETLNGSIFHQAKTDVIEKATKNIITESGENTEFKVGRNMVFNVANNARFTIKGSDGLNAKVQNGELKINAAKNIHITGKGGGDIHFEQNGGGFKIDSGGNVFIYGEKVMLGGQSKVNFIGKINYQTTTPTIPISAQLSALQMMTVVESADEGKPFCELCEKLKQQRENETNSNTDK